MAQTTLDQKCPRLKDSDFATQIKRPSEASFLQRGPSQRSAGTISRRPGAICSSWQNSLKAEPDVCVCVCVLKTVRAGDQALGQPGGGTRSE